MPVIKRSVEPIYVCRGEIPKDARNELEAVAVNTLSGVIFQLSSLAYHAENIFGELFKEATSIFDRTCNAQKRIDQLSDKVTKLDSTIEEISLQSINMQKAFKMTIHCDSQVTARSTIPDAMQEVYENSEPVPELDSLNEFRSDGKSSLKFYTDPNYFFELWMEKMNKELESKKRKKKKAREKKSRDSSKGKVKAIPKKQYKNVPTWEMNPHTKKVTTETIPTGRPPSVPAPIQDSDSYLPPPPNASPAHSSMSKRNSSASSIGRPSSVPPPPPVVSPSKGPAPPPPPPVMGVGQPVAPPPPPPPPGQVSHGGGNTFPPPPPPTITQGVTGPPPPPPVGIGGTTAPPPPPPPPISGPPAPPPPLAPGMAAPPGVPPPPSGGVAPPPPPTTGSGLGGPDSLTSALLQQGKRLAPASDRALNPPPDDQGDEDDRNDLLNAIRKGMQLKKAQERKLNEKKQDEKQGMDVASILARRIAMELSDSEDDDDDDYSSDDWNDDD
eukprot:Seg584.1 transcript_id=Seg584.1/GoldUCD/mRNA.D3Y31 product="Wiskott-Aldrich syndrome protein family member 2" protein_id=Seg584.1/GoldUCD/D3Y31